jgi:hypothetical protein
VSIILPVQHLESLIDRCLCSDAYTASWHSALLCPLRALPSSAMPSP